jgi:type IV fimbrial biogenesis protein FimT
MTTRTHTGFTLIELMIALSILGVLLGIALPAFSSARSAARTQQLRDALIAALTESRSAAAFYENDTILCPSADGERCADSFEWQQGFIAAIDLNNNEVIDDADRRLLYQHDFQESRLLTSSGRRRIQFQPNGSNAGSNATFTFCDERGPTRATSLVMNNRGDLREQRPSATQVAAACQI